MGKSDFVDMFGNKDQFHPVPQQAQPAATDAPMEQQRVAATFGGESAARNLQNGETAVSKIPRSRYKPFNDTEQVIMNYYKYNAAKALSATTAVGHSYRINSIYDSEITPLTYVEDPTPASDAAGAIVNTPHMRPYWMTWYRYWTVVKCDWHIRVIPNTRLTLGEADVYLYFHGLQCPPLATSTPSLITYQYRRLHPNMMHKRLIFDTTGSVNDSLLEKGVTFSGTWYPGMVRHEVHEDEFHQVWNQASEAPPQREAVTILVQPSDRNEADPVNLTYRLEVSFDYHVQLKDLKAKFEYLTSESGFSAVSVVAQQN